MADELIQAGIFERMSTWWNTNPTKNFSTGGLSSSPYCSIAVGGEGVGAMWPVGDHQILNNMGVLGGTNKSTVPRSSATFFEDPHMVDSSTFQPMGFGTTAAWNHQDLIHGSSDGDYNTNMLQSDMSSYGQTTTCGIMNPTSVNLQAGEWSSTTCGGGAAKDINCNSSPSTVMNSAGNSSGTEGSSSTITSDGQIPVPTSSFPVESSPLFPRLLHGDLQPPSSNWHSSTQVLGPSFARQREQQIINGIRSTLLGGSPASPCSPQSQSRKIINPKGNKNEEGCDLGSVSVDPSFKRLRIETPSPLPTFKVRKEKLGDRITALQQLVSPFGKTDTASVLHEAIEYIKFLRDQVNVLSTPYMRNGAPLQHPHKEANHNQKSKTEGEVPKQDLRSRGLCLVPISSTFPVAQETPSDFWTPTFGTSFR